MLTWCVEIFEETGQIEDKKRRGRPKNKKIKNR